MGRAVRRACAASGHDPRPRFDKGVHASSGQQRRRRRRPRHPRPRRRPARRRPRGPGGRARPRPLRRQQFAHPGRAGARASSCDEHDLARRTARPTDCVHVAHHRHARGRAGHRRVRHQQHRQPRRRRDLFRHRRRGDGRPLPRPAGGGDVAGRPSTTTAAHYETAARAAVEIIARLRADPLPADTILNVNVPDLPWDEVRGFEVTRLGNRHRAEACIPQQRSARPPVVVDRRRPARSRTPAPAPISTRCAPATSRSRRSTST